MSSYTYEALQAKYKNFITPAVTIVIDGEAYTNKEIPISNLEVEITADGGAGGCSFSIDSQYKAEQSQWKNGFDSHVKPGASLAIQAGYMKQKEIFYGFVDDYSFAYSGTIGSQIDITGIDGLGYLMNLREPLYAGQQEARSLVQSILMKSQSAGFAKSVTIDSLPGFGTPAIKEQVDDWTFLNLMARRYGMSLFAVDGELIFKDVISFTSKIITLGVRNGLRSFTKRVSLGHQVGKVEVWGRDVNQKPIKGTADRVSIGSEGKSASQHVSALGKAVMREYSEFVRTEAECTKLAQNRLNEIALCMVSGEGTCIGIPEIIPGRYIGIKGLDSATDGSYFISKVKHKFSDNGYSTTFEVKGAKTK